MFTGNTETNITATYQDGDGTIDLVATGDVSLVTSSLDYLSISGPAITLGQIDNGDDTNLAAGTNITLSGDTLNVDDAFLKNDASDTTSGTITAGGFTTTGTWTFDSFTSGTVGITSVHAGNSFNDNDTSLMTAGAIKDKIEGYGYTTNTGDITGVDLTGANGIAISSETNTTSGAYSSTVGIDISTLSSLSSEPADEDLFVVEIATDGSIKKLAYTEIKASSITIDGTTANGVLTYGGTNNIDTESTLTYGSSVLEVQQQVKVTDGTRDIRLNSNHGSKAAVGTVGAHDFNFFTANTIRATVDSGGNFGIGTESPDRPLNVNRSGDGNVARFSHSGSTGSVDIYSAAAGGLINVRNGSGTSTINIDARNDKINLIDSIKLTLGTGNDLEIYHNGSHNYFDTNNGNFYFRDESDNNLFTIAREGNGIQVYEGDIVIPATGKLRLDNSTSGDTYIYEESANVMCFRSHGSDRMKIGPYGQGVMISENFGGTDDYVHINPANGGNRTMTITGDNIDVITNGAGSNNLNLQANGGNVVFGGAISGVSTLTTSSTITTNYGVALTNGATNFLMYNNTNDNILYMRDTTNSAMIQTWGVNNVQIHKGLIINETGGNYDTRIEGDTDTDLFYIDASTDRVGISTNTPGNLFTVQGTSGYQASIQHDASTRLRISVESSGRSRFYTDNSANVGIESGGLYVQPTKKFFLDGGLDTWLNEPTGNTIGFGAGGAERMRMTTTGLGIGEASPSTYLHFGAAPDARVITFDQSGRYSGIGTYFAANATDSRIDFFLSDGGTNNDTNQEFAMYASGNFHADADVIAYSSSVGSDIKLKKNVEDISYGLDDVLKMRAVEFDWKEKRQGKHDIGVIAQELEKIIPEVVQEVDTLKTDGETHKVVDYAKLTSVLIKAIQQQQEEIELLKANYDDLKYNRSCLLYTSDAADE